MKLEDQTSFLSSKLMTMNNELSSSQAYIDKLYEELESKNCSPSKELKADFERKELEWMELERKYTQRIHKLEGQVGVGSDSKHKVSMDAYMEVVKQTRHYKFESMKLQQTIDSLNERLEKMHMSPVTNGGGKSARVLQAIEQSKQMVHGNDENVAPPPPPPPHAPPSQAKEQNLVVKQQQRGKHNRVAVVKAAGGRKGLKEQLKRARRGLA